MEIKIGNKVNMIEFPSQEGIVVEIINTPGAKKIIFENKYGELVEVVEWELEISFMDRCKNLFEKIKEKKGE